jgi:hypothetical protein
MRGHRLLPALRRRAAGMLLPAAVFLGLFAMHGLQATPSPRSAAMAVPAHCAHHTAPHARHLAGSSPASHAEHSPGHPAGHSAAQHAGHSAPGCPQDSHVSGHGGGAAAGSYGHRAPRDAPQAGADLAPVVPGHGDHPGGEVCLGLLALVTSLLMLLAVRRHARAAAVPGPPRFTARHRAESHWPTAPTPYQLRVIRR